MNIGGKVMWLWTSMVPLKDQYGIVNSVLGVSRDISERKSVELLLQESKDLLEKRVAERTADLADAQDRLRNLAREVISAQEEERQRVSRELHDEAGQALVSLNLSLDQIRDELPDDQYLVREHLSRTIQDVNLTMQQIRSLAYSLRSPVLDVLGINLGLKDFCQDFSERTHFPISYRGVDLPDLPEEIGISLYRFVQEAVTNAIKHAHPTRIWVRLGYRHGTISLSVKDDGEGFHPEFKTDGIGLMGMRDRVSLLNGKLELNAASGSGTMITALVPWQKKKVVVRDK